MECCTLGVKGTNKVCVHVEYMSISKERKIAIRPAAVACYRMNIRWMRKIGGREIVRKAQDMKIDTLDDDSTNRHMGPRFCIGPGNADDIGET